MRWSQPARYELATAHLRRSCVCRARLASLGGITAAHTHTHTHSHTHTHTLENLRILVLPGVQVTMYNPLAAGASTEEVEPAPGSVMHVRGIGVEGWDGAADGHHHSDT
jgi:hypothetical protein